VLTVGHGGTGDSSLTINSVLIGNGTNPVVTTLAGTTGQVLIGATGSPPSFAGITSTGGTISFTSGPNSLNIESVGISGVLTVGHGGTGDSSLTINSVLIGNGTNPVVTTLAGTTGQVLIGATGSPPSFAGITSTGGTISFTSGPNSLNIDVIDSGVPWHDVTINGTTAAPNSTLTNSGYSTDAGTARTYYILPTTANFGDSLYITGRSKGGVNTGGWELECGAGQVITLGADTTTVGTAGYLASTVQTDSLRLIMVTPGTGITASEWNAIQAIGNIFYN
jgi:hypothetical protein